MRRCVCWTAPVRSERRQDSHDGLLSPPQMTVTWNDHCSVGGSDSRMRIKASALLSDCCWKIQAARRDWGASTVIFNGGNRLQTTDSVMLWGGEIRELVLGGFCFLMFGCEEDSASQATAISFWESTGSSCSLVLERFGLIESSLRAKDCRLTWRTCFQWRE